MIIHPKYRTTGLGTKLVKETLAKAGTPIVETVAVMAKHNPFFEKAGMHKTAESKPSICLEQTLESLARLGLNTEVLGNTEQTKEQIEHVEPDKVKAILQEFSKKEGSARKRVMSLNDVYPTHEQFMKKLESLNTEGIAQALKILAFLAQTKVYLFWQARKKT